MLRVSIPYGTLSTRQLRGLGDVARRFDRGYAHFTTRQNIQFHWIKLKDAPDALAALAEIDMHAIQTSGNCVRNVTSDPYAGAAADEIEDPRVWCEAIRQWSTLHPEFSYLPRKFKIAVTAAAEDRAAVAIHDIGLRLRRDARNQIGFEVMVGGGLGRTPRLARTIREFLPQPELLPYLEAILRVYNQEGRRDNIHKARIKILVDALGAETFRDRVEAEYAASRDFAARLPDAELARIRAMFAPPAYDALDDDPPARAADPAFDRWAAVNVARHRQPGYAIATISLKPVGGIPGDITAAQMDAVADLADRYSLGEVRVTHTQNLVLPHVPQRELHALWRALSANGLGTANLGRASDIIACPGLDYCSLANARSIPVAQRIGERLAADPAREARIGPLAIKISGCINACGHHHVGDIGLLGVDRNGAEAYQMTLGGDAGENAALGAIVGRAFSYDEVPDAVDAVLEVYLAERRDDGERLAQTVRRVGLQPFKERLYGADQARPDRS
jgi:sulfite reductase (NADPH) hemoprotein beta-component